MQTPKNPEFSGFFYILTKQMEANMSRAYGWNAQLLIAEESEYGVLPDSGYRQIPFISSSLDSEQSLVSSNVLGLGRDPTQPFQDVINVDGDMAIPIDFRNIGVWLRAIFGAPTTNTKSTSLIK